jgi:DNA helicase II / ATP-dependent DNA helicase PcrA
MKTSAGRFRLSPEQQRVVDERARDLQVIACAGSGKTESISRRIARLLAEGAAPAAVVAFTFTERAAAELRERVIRRVTEAQGTDARERLGPMFVGTIHSYCFRILNEHVPEYGNYDVLDEHRHAGFLGRYFFPLNLHRLGGRLRQALGLFLRSCSVIHNELIDPAKLPSDSRFTESYRLYRETLARNRFLTYDLLIAEAVRVLEESREVYERVHGPLRYLVVDEYQDINPAQERLIELLSRRPVELCVVGDDDQSIYQWRGADVRNIVGFRGRRRHSVAVTLDTNRRSRPGIVEAAAAFAESIPGRLRKRMKACRKAGENQVVPWRAETEEEEAAIIADTILRLRRRGFAYRDMAVLFRSVRTSGRPLIVECEKRQIPINCAGRTSLFLQPEISLFGEAFVWLGGGDWKHERFGQRRTADLAAIVAGLHAFFPRGPSRRAIERHLTDWKKRLSRQSEPVNLVGDFYGLLSFLHAEAIDVDLPQGSARFGAYARFSRVLADFEHVHRRGRRVEENGARVFHGARDRGPQYLGALGKYLLYYAFDAYEEFEGEPAVDQDAVAILTVHQAKGLEWPVVFLPALVRGRFPSSYAGRPQEWCLPSRLFRATSRARYEGSDAEERRLFYVALTRARDTVYLSHFERRKNAFKPSDFLVEVAGEIPRRLRLPLPDVLPGAGTREPPALDIAFSDLAFFHECGYRYRLGTIFGFEQELATELGYGKAIHHVLRHIAERSRTKGRPPSAREIERIVEDEFYLPFANRLSYEQMQRAARRIVDRYVADHPEDLQRIWATERPFALHVEGGVVSGRADVILDEEEGRAGALALVDYKAAKDDRRREIFELQLRIYAAAGRGEGLDVAAAYLHELKEARRRTIDVTPPEARAATAAAVEMIAEIRHGRFKHRAGPKTCASCAYTLLCRHAHSTARGSSGGTRDPGLRTSTGPKAGRVAGRVGLRVG